MGPNQHKNWGVTFEWFDKLRGTRVPYVGTVKELAERPKQIERAKRMPHRASWRDAVRAIRRSIAHRAA